ncbi:ATP-binding cassette domain-containing protein [Neptunicella marina]|uniref:ATP-binding cassette domain-containing protein n=1 Tax=Neptunicella marina TaxID=2125989 RepID=A0A8J6IQS7_9ALTE|nr:ATP-binding cassette domain-containing protein [Neptunicella marina]
MLEFDQIALHYDARVIFEQFSLAIPQPRVVISGANGTGKTTLLMLAAGLIAPQAGQVTFNGESVLSSQVKKQIGISATKVALPGFLSVKALLEFHAGQFGCSAEHALIDDFKLKQYFATKVADLSLGNYKKLSLVTAVMHQPQLLLLDEPTNGLDEQSLLVLNSLISDYPGQVVIASHQSMAADSADVRHIALKREGVTHT